MKKILNKFVVISFYYVWMSTKNNQMARKEVAKLATVLTVLVTNYFSTHNCNQNGHSLEHCTWLIKDLA